MKVNIGKYPKDDTKERKIDVKIDKWDSWDLYTTLAYVIHPALVDFKSNLSGYPVGLEEEEWGAILDKMIHSFDLIIKDEFISPGDLTNEQWFEQIRKKEEEIKEGLDLFAEYYQNLWN